MDKDKLIKNEQIIRDNNRMAGKALKKYFGSKKGVLDTPLKFICECSDMGCSETVSVTVREYEKLHKRNDRFLIVKGHKTPQIEKTIADRGKMELVEKPSVAP